MADLFYRVTFKAASTSYDASGDVVSVSLTQEEVGAVELVVTLEDPFRVLGHALQEGMDVELDLGTIANHSVLFTGRIYKVDTSSSMRAIPSLKVYAYDDLMKLGLRRRKGTWESGKISDLVKTVLAESGISDPEVRLYSDPELTDKHSLLQEENDLKFLGRIAEFMGCVMFARTVRGRAKIHFVPEAEEFQKTPAIALRHGEFHPDLSLRSFKAQVDVGELSVTKVFRSFDPDGKPIEETREPQKPADVPDRNFQENMATFSAERPKEATALKLLVAAARNTPEAVRKEVFNQTEEVTIPGTMTKAALKTIADTIRPTRRNAMFASGEIDGNSSLRAPMMIEIKDVSGRFQGKWFVSKTRHVLDREGYRTEFECRR